MKAIGDCPQIIAGCLSPELCLRHWFDPTVTEYLAETNNMNDRFDPFKLLCQGLTIKVTEANRGVLLSVSREFLHSEVESFAIICPSLYSFDPYWADLAIESKEVCSGTPMRWMKSSTWLQQGDEMKNMDKNCGICGYNPKESN
jgi:hypothetical protein